MKTVSTLPLARACSIAALAALAFAVSFAVGYTLERRKGAQEADPPRHLVHRLPEGPRVWEVTLSDGTPCAVSSAGGITCGWLWDDGADPGYEDAAEMGPPAPGAG